MIGFAQLVTYVCKPTALLVQVFDSDASEPQATTTHNQKMVFNYV